MPVPPTSPKRSPRIGSNERGHSLLELLIVVSLIVILTAIAIFALNGNKAAYKADDQSIKILDFIREANSRALTYRETTRLEIDTTDNEIRIIDENSNTTTTDDKEVRAMPLEKVVDVVVDKTPSGITVPNPPNYTAATYATDTIGHLEGSTTVTGHRVWSIRFKSDGTVINNSNAVTSSTLFIYPPLSASTLDTPKNTKLVRAITIFGGSVGVKLWKYNGSAWVASN